MAKSDSDQSRVVLTSPLVPKPIHYRYAWARNPHASLIIRLGQAAYRHAAQRLMDFAGHVSDPTPAREPANDAGPACAQRGR